MRYVAILDGQEHEIEIEELAADSFSIRFGKDSFEADLRRVGPVSFSVIVNNRSFDFDVARDGEETVGASRTGSTGSDTSPQKLLPSGLRTTRMP